MLGGWFGRARKTFASRHEAFAAFVLAQFLPQYRWEIPEADFSEWTHAAGSEFQNVSQMWFLIYCAWLFRLASIHRYGYDFQRDVMAALRMRLAKRDASEIGPLKVLPNLLEFWFQKLDAAVIEVKPNPTLNGQEMPLTYPAAIAFIAGSAVVTLVSCRIRIVRGHREPPRDCGAMAAIRAKGFHVFHT